MKKIDVSEEIVIIGLDYIVRGNSNWIIISNNLESCEQIHRHETRVGFKPTTFAILGQIFTTRPPRLPGS